MFFMKKMNVLPFQNVKNRYLRMFLIVGEFFLLMYILSCIGLYFLQDKLIFVPKDKIVASPKDYGIDFENVYFSSKNDQLHGYYVKNKKQISNIDNSATFNPQDFTIFYCHGNAGNVSYRSEQIKMYYDLGFNVFVFDYSGYGQSSGKPSAEAVEQNTIDAWHYLTKEKKVPREKIIVVGRSLGGFAALTAAEKFSPFALSLESTFSSIKNIAQHQMPLFPTFLILKNNFDNIAKIKRIKVPIFMVHSKDDNVVKYYHSQKLLKAANANENIPTISFKSFIGNHNGCYDVSENNYPEEFFNFFKKIYETKK